MSTPRPDPAPRIVPPHDMAALLDLERIDTYLFRGGQPDDAKSRMFGGQVIAQSLMAAALTVPEGRAVHSLHCYFLLMGDPTRPTLFLVEPIRDGRSYTTRRVLARQDGRDIFALTTSFKVPETDIEHQPVPPARRRAELDPPASLPEPEDLPDPPPSRPGFHHAVEIRAVPDRPDEVEGGRPVQHHWVRSIGNVPDDALHQAAALAYASDLTMLNTALAGHGISPASGDVMMASIDHAMWFHRPFRADEWLLHRTVSPALGDGRGLVRAEIYDRRGVLVATANQEGVIRRHRPREDRAQA